MPFKKVSITNIPAEQQEILIARLSEIGYSGFEQFDKELFAFIEEHDFDEQAVKEMVDPMNLNYSQENVPEQNWNNSWESNFPPVTVHDFVAIRAEFHKPIEGVEHEILITPKMSFGTGHHATTVLMIEEMRELSFKGKNILDFGTGTGILAILAEKLGAGKITAIDYDEWSISNAIENRDKNGCERIIVGKQDNAATKDLYGIILANINRNVILDNLYLLSKQLEPGGDLLLSGLLAADEQVIMEAAGKHGLKEVGIKNKQGWILLRFTH